MTKPKDTLVHLIQTGGTVGMSKNHAGTLAVDKNVQEGVVGVLNNIPFTRYVSVPSPISGDSSDHTRAGLIALGKTALSYAHHEGGIIVAHGTDTMNLAAATLALMGNEVWKYPLVLLGSMGALGKEGSDALPNAITAGMFAAYGDGSGIFAVRQNGVVITSRHDTPGGSIDWHGRGIPQATQAYFARVHLENLVDDAGNFTFDARKKKKHHSPKQELEQLIEYQRKFHDGTLDHHDHLVVGGRGWRPPVQILGYSKKKLLAFKERPFEDSPAKVVHDVVKLVREEITEGRLVSPVIPYLAFVEAVRRHRRRKEVHFDEWWPQVIQQLTRDLGFQYYGIDHFWEAYSDKANDTLDFSGILTVNASVDPHYLEQLLRSVPPQALVIRATGSAGLRLAHAEESFEPCLAYCKAQEIPVVLTAGSRGECTSFEYGPGLYALEHDLVFFAGTMDSDLVEPRLALLNHPQNKSFLHGLVDLLDVDAETKRALRRNMYRQLLSGTHYRASAPGELSDRKRIEQLYGIETSVDLLAGVQVSKAILAAFLHETFRCKQNLPRALEEYLSKKCRAEILQEREETLRYNREPFPTSSQGSGGIRAPNRGRKDLRNDITFP